MENDKQKTKFNVRKIKGAIPDYHEGIGPSETITIGLDINGHFISFGKYYIGPYMNEEHVKILNEMELFIDECVRLFT